MRGEVVRCGGFNVSEIVGGDRTLVVSPFDLSAVECRWEKETLRVELEGSFAELKVWAPGVEHVVLNGNVVTARREGAYLILQYGHAPFLEILSPRDSMMVLGSQQTLRVRVWNPTNRSVEGVFSMSLSEGWEEMVRSQVE
ncbi:MAG: hypothetical protein KAJ12_08285, partial [Bacteroidetes bacterium]|nr:hypothetical protein [Bacteroidota bacterium]